MRRVSRGEVVDVGGAVCMQTTPVFRGVKGIRNIAGRKSCAEERVAMDKAALSRSSEG